MGAKIAGTAFITVSGLGQIMLRGNLNVSPSVVERVMISNQHGVAGFQEVPRTPFIEGEFSTTRELNLEDLEYMTNVTVVALLANGKQYSLEHAVCRSALESNPRDGQVRIRWEGLWCTEL